MAQRKHDLRPGDDAVLQAACTDEPGTPCIVVGVMSNDNILVLFEGKEGGFFFYPHDWLDLASPIEALSRTHVQV